MKNRTVLKEFNVPPKGRTEFARRYDIKNPLKLGYRIDVPEDVRHQVKVERKRTGTLESGLEEIFIHNQSSCPARITFFEFEE
jgi:hypothetical protein